MVVVLVVLLLESDAPWMSIRVDLESVASLAVDQKLDITYSTRRAFAGWITSGGAKPLDYQKTCPPKPPGGRFDFGLR